MIIIGTPKTSEFDQYYMADGDTIIELTRAGFCAKFVDEEVQYFKLNAKLKKYLEKHGLG